MSAFHSPFSGAARRAWISVGAPILGLVALVAALAVGLVADFARKQDANFADESRRLVAASVETHAHALTNLTLDYAVWSDAFRNITAHWRPTWVKRNFYSVVADGMVIFRADGRARYTWVASALAPQSATLAQAAVAAARADGRLDQWPATTTPANLARTSSTVVNGRLVLITVAPISLESAVRPAAYAHRPADYLVTFDVLDDSDVSATGTALDLEDFRFTTEPATSADTLSLPLFTPSGAAVGAFEWRNERPGAHAFDTRVWPIMLGLLLVGALAALMSHHLVSRHVRFSVQADSALDASRLKSEFIATMSHELRTPLNAIIGYAELIDEQAEPLGRDGAILRSDAGHVLTAAKHLQQLVNDILDQSRLDAGRLQLKPDYLVVSSLLAEITELMQAMADAKQLAFIYHVEADANAVIVDQARLRQCLLNLAGNAIKFTETGSVRINVCRRDDAIVFDVADTGIGIDRRDLGKLFTPFSQAEGVQERFGGTGLGLVISRKLARAMGGDIVVTSALGKGSVFTLSVPAIGQSVANAA